MGKENRYAVSRSCGRHLRAQGFCSRRCPLRHPRKSSEKYDLALIKADVRCAAAGVYTTNKVCGAPIKVDRAHLKDGYAQAIVVNSGNANTCAANGVALAEECCELVGKALDIDRRGCSARLHRRHRPAHGHRPLCPGHPCRRRKAGG